ncbi:TetR/AcrR family transcriptional regulator [Novosphingobium sp.]|uniref:TetR/AcrR family transcriptional regulator n=1 Tax=Novosphingobium sp. TaxID=1874826 RepID=UPI0035B1AD68
MATKATRSVKTAPASGIGRRERNKLEKRNRIVAAARRLFAEHGFAETTTLQIAEAADIGTGTLFLYARSKEDLLVMVFHEEMLATAQQAFSDLPLGMPLVDQVMQVFERMVAYHEGDLTLAKLLLKEILMPDRQDRAAELSKLMSAIFEGFARLVITAQKDGVVAERFEPDLVAQSFFALYYLGLLNWLGGLTTREAFFAKLRRQLEQLLDCA